MNLHLILALGFIYAEVILIPASIVLFAATVHMGRRHRKKRLTSYVPVELAFYEDRHRKNLILWAIATSAAVVCAELALRFSGMPEPTSLLFHFHLTMDFVLFVLGIIAVRMNGSRSPHHKLIVYPLAFVYGLVIVTGATQVWQLWQYINSVS